MSSISIRKVNKAYQKNKLVIENLSLEVFKDEFLVLVGPSGSGKTTTLRMVAGIEEVSEGEIYINDQLQNDQDPSNRNLSFVFQNYALLPHFTVYDNIEFGLGNAKISKLEKKRKVEKVAHELGIFDKLGSFPALLSGGQRQRVALARALVDDNELILFDEPLSNLDALLRSNMRTHLVKYREYYNLTSLYVTHDQLEAMSMATRIVLLEEGKIVQVGTPKQLYDSPNHLGTISFIGTPEANILKGYIKNNYFMNDQLRFKLNEESKGLLENYNEEIYYAIRPEDIKVFSSKTNDNLLEVNYNFKEFLGDKQLIDFTHNNVSIKVLVKANFIINDVMYLDLTNKPYLFDKSKVRIKAKKSKDFKIEFNEELTSLEKQLIRELKNYGYKLNDHSDNIIIKKQNNNNYVLKIGETEHLIENLFNVLKHLEDERW